MKNYIKISLLLLLVSCNNQGFKVGYKGQLRDMMVNGNISKNAELKDYENIKHFYALGAIENLKGEIQIFNSKPINSSVVDNKLIIDNTYNKNANLLVYGAVKDWETINIPDTIKNYDQFEIFVNQAANSFNIDTEKPYPFLLEGVVDSLQWHVIDWKDGDTLHTHEKHKKAGLKGTLINTKIEALGFYSKSHHAIFTHHSTNMHIHSKTSDGEIAGHVDDLILGNKMILKIPKVK